LSLFGTGRREGTLAVVVLLLLALVQHAPGLWFGQHRRTLPPDTASWDHATARLARSERAHNDAALVPAMRQAARSLDVGELPLWNDLARFGEPFPSTGAPLLYPPYWLLAAGLGDTGLDLLLWLHSMLACCLAYRFLRSLPLSRFVAFVGGGIWGLGWFLTVALDRLPEAAAAALLPWAFELARRTLSARSRVAHAPTLGFAVALLFATGGTETATLGTLACAAFLLAGLGAIEHAARGRVLRACGVAAATAVLLTTPLWLASLELRSTTHTAEAVPQGRLQVAGLAGAIAPGLFGEFGRAPDTLREVNPDADSLELVLYPGALLLFLAGLGLFRPKRTWVGLFWLCVGAPGLLLALDAPLGHWLAGIGLGLSRPGASLVLFHFALVVLGSVTLENFFDAPLARRATTPLVAGTALAASAAVAFAACLDATWLQETLAWLSGNAIAAELEVDVRHALRCLAWPTIGLTLLAILFLVWRRLGILRFKALLACVALGEPCLLALAHVPRAPTSVAPALAEFLPADSGRVLPVGRAELPPAAWLAADGVRAVATDGTAILDRTARYLSSLDPSLVGTRHRSYLFPLLAPHLLNHPLAVAAGIAAFVAADPVAVDGFLPLTARPATTTANPTVHVGVRAEPTPRARLAFRAVAVDSADRAEHALERLPPALDHVVIERAESDFEPKLPSRPTWVGQTLDTPNHSRLEVDLADGRGYLLLADAWAPGWQATVDDQPTPILPANLAFRAVPLREGRHTVELRYRPLYATLGIPLLGLGLALTLLGVLAGAFVRRR
jgi:hypothetical protein